MIKLGYPYAKNIFAVLDCKTDSNLAMPGELGYDREADRLSRLSTAESCQHAVGYARYGNAHGKFAKCKNPRCQAKFRWSEDVKGWLSSVPSQVSSSRLPPPSMETIRDPHFEAPSPGQTLKPRIQKETPRDPIMGLTRIVTRAKSGGRGSAMYHRFEDDLQSCVNDPTVEEQSSAYIRKCIKESSNPSSETIQNRTTPKGPPTGATSSRTKPVDVQAESEDEGMSSKASATSRRRKQAPKNMEQDPDPAVVYDWDDVDYS
jgi:hypothetical protein